MWMIKKEKIILCPTGNGHPDVVRIRSAHRKDLETVFPFLLITPLWLNVETCNSTVRILIPAFSMISIMYTVVHMKLIKLSAPWKFYLHKSLYIILTYICAMTALRYTIYIPKLI